MKEVTDAVSNSITERPDEHDAIKDEAVILLKRARAIGVFPTPVEKLIAAADVDQLDDVEEAKQSFLQAAPAHMRSQLESAWTKLRGFADLKKKVNYIAPEGDSVRQKWPKLHELGHQILPWQQETATFLVSSFFLSGLLTQRFSGDFSFDLPG